MFDTQYRIKKNTDNSLYYPQAKVWSWKKMRFIWVNIKKKGTKTEHYCCNNREQAMFDLADCMLAFQFKGFV